LAPNSKNATIAKLITCEMKCGTSKPNVREISVIGFSAAANIYIEFISAHWKTARAANRHAHNRHYYLPAR